MCEEEEEDMDFYGCRYPAGVPQEEMLPVLQTGLYNVTADMRCMETMMVQFMQVIRAGAGPQGTAAMEAILSMGKGQPYRAGGGSLANPPMEGKNPPDVTTTNANSPRSTGPPRSELTQAKPASTTGAELT